MSERIRGLRQCAIQIDVYFTLLQYKLSVLMLYKRTATSLHD